VSDAIEDKPDQTAASSNPPNPQPRQLTPDQQLDFFLANPAQCNVHGMLAVTRQFPPEIALPAIARAYAMVLSHLTSAGDFGAILRVRGACKQAFSDGIGKVPIQAPQEPPPTGGDIKKVLMNGGQKFG
jgi:hypothetical protein